jgi:hypothetical protein
MTQADLVGKYYFGDGLGVNCSLTLDSIGRFSFQWHGCVGEYDRNLGPARLQGGLLTLEPKNPNVREGFRGTATSFLPIRWSARFYLVPKDEILDFINEINQGGEPRDHAHGLFYLREEDWKKKVTGQPDLAPEWTSLLLAEPAVGEILAIQGDRLTINLGRKQGVWEKMVLTAHSPDRLFIQLRVESVSENSCVATRKYRSESREVEVGQKVTSRFHDW